MVIFDTGNIDYEIAVAKLPKHFTESKTYISDEEAKRLEEINDNEDTPIEEWIKNNAILDHYYLQKAIPNKMLREPTAHYAIINSFLHHKGISQTLLEEDYEVHHTIVEHRHPYLLDQIKLLQMFFPTKEIPESYYEVPKELSSLHSYSDEEPPAPNSMYYDVKKQLNRYYNNLAVLQDLAKRAGKTEHFSTLPDIQPDKPSSLPLEYCFTAGSLNEMRETIQKLMHRHNELAKELTALRKKKGET